MRRTKTGTGRMKYMKRAIKRASNRERFNKLFPLLKQAIMKAQEQTGKRWAPKKEISKQRRKLEKQEQNKEKKRVEFIKDVIEQVKQRLSQEENKQDK